MEAPDTGVQVPATACSSRPASCTAPSPAPPP